MRKKVIIGIVAVLAAGSLIIVASIAYLLTGFVIGTRSFWTGYATMNAGDYTKAAQSFDKTIALPVGARWRAYALANRGYCFEWLKENKRAMADYSAALRLMPRLTFALQRRGFVKDSLGQPDSAYADYTAALQIDPNLGEAWRRCGLYQMRLDHHERAVADFREAIRSFPGFEAAYREQGEACRLLGDHEGALSSFDAAIALMPRDAQAYCGRGRVFLERYDFPRALADLDYAALLAPSDRYILRWRAIAYYRMDDYNTAIAQLNEILKLDPKDEHALQRRALAYRQIKHYEHALADFTELIRISHTKDAYIDRARTYARAGRYSLAVADYHEAERHPHGSFHSHSKRLPWLLATCPVDKFRNSAEALRLASAECDSTMWLEKDDLDTFAAACAEAGRFDEAVYYEERALQISENDPEWDIHASIRLALFRNHQPYREQPEK